MPPELGDDAADKTAGMVVNAVDDGDTADDVDDNGDEGIDGEEEETPGPSEIEALRSELESQHKAAMANLKKENSRLGYALRKAEAAKPDDKPQPFTDAQLLQMMKDHQDEPEVMFQIMKEMTNQSGVAIERSAEKKADIRAKSKEIGDMAERVFPGALKEDSGVYADVQMTKSYLGLDDNPYGDVLSLAMMNMNNMPNLVENVKAQVKKELLGKTADSKRKGKIKSESLSDKGHDKETRTKLSPELDETAKKLGMNDRQMKRYKAIMAKSKKSGVMQVEI
jgi:hypothetical protein